jgi:hypothetical protein
VIVITQVFKSNAAQHGDIVLSGKSFEAEVFFPKIRNVNRLSSEHRDLTMHRTEKFDGQQVAAQRRGDCLIFYSRNGILDLQSLGKGINKVWADTDWEEVAAALAGDETAYFEAVGNHKDFTYTDIFPSGCGLIAFALRNVEGRILDRSLLPELPIPRVSIQESGRIPDVESLRQLLTAGREGYVFTGYTASGEYVAYKAKRRELLEEATDEEKEAILTSGAPPEVKIAKIVCTVAKVKHILQRLKDGELPVQGAGIAANGRWDGSNAIIPTLIRAVQNDCKAEAGETMEALAKQLGVRMKQVNQALEDRVRTAFFDLTLHESLK